MANISTYFSSGGGSAGGPLPTCAYTASCLWTPHADGTVMFHVIGGGASGWGNGDRSAGGGAGGYSHKSIAVTTSHCYCFIIGGIAGNTTAQQIAGTTMCILGTGATANAVAGSVGSGGDVQYTGGAGFCYNTGSSKTHGAQGGSVGIYGTGRTGECSNRDIVLYPCLNFAPMIKIDPYTYLSTLPWNMSTGPQIPEQGVDGDGMKAYNTVGMPIKGLTRIGCCAGIFGERVCVGWFVGGNPNCGSAKEPESGCHNCAINAGCGAGGGSFGSDNGTGGKGIAFVEYLTLD